MSMSEYEPIDAHEAPLTPPIEPDGEDFEQQSRWPVVIGVIALIYALCGLLCQGGFAISSLFTEWLMSLAPWDTSHIKIPTSLRIIAIGLQIPVVLLGIYLIVSSAALIRRRRSGVRGIKRWAVLRMIMVFIGLVAGLFLAPANIDIQRQMQEAANEWAQREGQTGAIQEFNEDTAWTQAVISQAVIAGLACVFPLFAGLYLSRARITEELEQWP